MLRLQGFLSARVIRSVVQRVQYDFTVRHRSISTSSDVKKLGTEGSPKKLGTEGSSKISSTQTFRTTAAIRRMGIPVPIKKNPRKIIPWRELTPETANTARLLIPTSLSREILPLIPEKDRKNTKVFAATEDVQPDLLFKTLLSNHYVVFRGPLVALQVIYAKLRKEVAKADDLEADKEQLEVDPGKIFMKRRIEKVKKNDILNRLLIGFDLTGASLTSAKIECPASLRVLIKNVEESHPNISSVVISYHHYLGMKRADQWTVNGIPIQALGGKRIFPSYNVFPPTRQDYINLFQRVVEKHDLLHGVKTVLDIGCGTGVLSFITLSMAKARKQTIEVMGVDNLPEAIACARHNASLLNYDLELQQADVFPKLKAGSPFDLIICNPPFIADSPATIMDTAVYDEDSRMLKRLLRGVAYHLSSTGKLLLLYSDISARFGLQEEDVVERLCTKNQLEILWKEDAPSYVAEEADNYKPNPFRLPSKKERRKEMLMADPLFLFRKHERIQAFLIQPKA